MRQETERETLLAETVALSPALSAKKLHIGERTVLNINQCKNYARWQLQTNGKRVQGAMLSSSSTKGAIISPVVVQRSSVTYVLPDGKHVTVDNGTRTAC